MGFNLEEWASLAEFTAKAYGTYASYNASTQAAAQSRMNAQAQSQALSTEAQRQQLETAQAEQRKVMEQRRFSASQEAALSDNGFIGNTGSPLDILADTYTAQQRDLRDIGYQNDTNQWGLASRAQADIAEGNSAASAIKGQAGGTLLTNFGGMAGSAYGTYKGMTGSDYTGAGNTAIPYGYQKRPASQRLAAY